MEKFNDNTPMPFGKHKGEALINVPASYLLWYWEKNGGKLQHNSPLSVYIHENIEVIQRDAKNGGGNYGA